MQSSTSLHTGWVCSHLQHGQQVAVKAADEALALGVAKSHIVLQQKRLHTITAWLIMST